MGDVLQRSGKFNLTIACFCNIAYLFYREHYNINKDVPHVRHKYILLTTMLKRLLSAPI